MANIIWALIGLLVLFWVVGLVAKVGGAIIHFLLVVAIILLIINLIFGRKGT
ncbi:lmo0937 family membrane protein [Pseudogracilibacillus sp. SO10305]|uniref:lmo0937 family membrane protein n=1 Tax=Pseudogracilibacillus sp. SO10305 TaxID=3098292 RepID=UPI00300E323E